MTVVACFLMVMISLGFTSSTKSLFPDEIAKDLGVQRSLVSIGESCRYVATAVVNLFFGAVVAKFGPKKLVCAGFVSLIASMLLYSVANNLVMIYIAGCLLGIGLSWTSTTMVGYIIGIWCSENKGTIMGAVLASNGLGGAVAVQLAGSLIDPDTVGSYRAAYRMIAMVLVVAVVVVLILMREKPHAPGEVIIKMSKKNDKKDNSKKKRGQDWYGIEFSDAIKKWYFWGILVCIFFSGMILQGSHGIVAMHYKDVGIDYGMVKGMLSFGSLLIAAAKFMTGFIYDHKGLRITASACIFVSVISTALLALIKGNSVGFVLAMIYTVISQFSMPLETIMLPIYANDLFGSISYSKILGIFVSVNTAGYAVGAPIFNLCYDILGNYVPALVIVSVIMTAVLVLIQFVITAAHRERERIEASEEVLMK